MIWVATANDAHAIPEPILNRVNVYEVSAPDFEAARAIARRLYQKLRDGHDWGRGDAEPRCRARPHILPNWPARDALRLDDGFGNAHLAKRETLLIEGPASGPSSKRGKIGFVQ